MIELTDLKDAEALLDGKKGDGILMIHKPGCPACTYTKPKFWEASKSDAGRKAKWYAYSTQHGITGEFIQKYKCSGVPAIYRCKEGSEELKPYGGNRSVEDLAKFATE